MLKYLVGLGAVVVLGVGYLLLVPAGDTPAPPAEPVAESPGLPTEPATPTPLAPEAVAPPEAELAPPDAEEMLADMAADIREGLPAAVTGTLTMMDALFLPRMRIMEYVYVSSTDDTSAAAGDLRSMIESRAEPICLEGREMFLLGATLRSTFTDRDGNVFQRVYVLPEDCLQFY